MRLTEGKRLIYLDNAATTRPSPGAMKALSRAAECFYNPSSLYKGGLEAEALVKNAREEVARAVGGLPEEIFFTSGGTEGDNLVLASLNPRAAKHVIVSAVEHDAVIEPAKRLASLGVRVDFAPAGPDGIVSPGAVEALLTPETALVSVMAVNNETGAVQPVREIARVLKRAKSPALLHTDAVQSFLKTGDAPARLGADVVTVSAHKIHGVKGAGALWVRKGVRLRPQILGGGQERGLRSGTEAVPAILAMGQACREGFDSLSSRIEKVSVLHAYGAELLREVPGIEVLSFPTQSPWILTVSAPGYKSEILLHALADRGICVSSGAACSRGRISRVLTAMGVDRRIAEGFLRVSLSHENEKEDLSALAEALRALLPALRKAR